MAANRKKFLGPNAGTLRDPVSNAQKHGKMVNPPRFPQFGGFSNSTKAISKNDMRLTSVGGSVE